MQNLWAKHGEQCAKKRMSFIDTYFASLMRSKFLKFKQRYGAPEWRWHHIFSKYVKGLLPSQFERYV